VASQGATIANQYFTFEHPKTTEEGGLFENILTIKIDYCFAVVAASGDTKRVAPD